jgi:hypothetical protein
MRVYALFTLLPEPHTFRLVIGRRYYRRGNGSNR